MKITGWTYWDNPDYKEMFSVDEPCTAMDEFNVKYLISGELRKNGYKFTGGYHQNGEFGVPIIDNKWLYQCSQRVWGGIMAMAYPDEIDDSDGMGYVEWAWDSEPTNLKAVLPKG